MASALAQQPRALVLTRLGELNETDEWQPAENLSARHSTTKQVKDYSDKTLGAYRLPKVASSVIRLGADVAQSMGTTPRTVAPAIHVSRVLSNVANSLSVMRAVSLGCGLSEDIEKAQKNSTFKNIIEVVKNTFDFMSSAFYSAVLFTGLESAKVAGDVTGLVPDVVDIGEAVSGLKEINDNGEKIDKAAASNEAIVQAKKDTRNLQLLKLAKAVLAVAGTILGLLGLFLGGPIVPAIALLAISICSATFSIWGYFHEQNMQAISLLKGVVVVAPQPT